MYGITISLEYPDEDIGKIDKIVFDKAENQIDAIIAYLLEKKKGIVETNYCRNRYGYFARNEVEFKGFWQPKPEPKELGYVQGVTGQPDHPQYGKLTYIAYYSAWQEVGIGFKKDGHETVFWYKSQKQIGVLQTPLVIRMILEPQPKNTDVQIYVNSHPFILESVVYN